MSSQIKNRIRSMGVLLKCCVSKHTADGTVDPRCWVQWQSRHSKQRCRGSQRRGSDVLRPCRCWLAPGTSPASATGIWLARGLRGTSCKVRDAARHAFMAAKRGWQRRGFAVWFANSQELIWGTWYLVRNGRQNRRLTATKQVICCSEL